MESIIDNLVTLLDSIQDISFRKDCWEENDEPNYGVAELTGESEGEWADGVLIDASYNAQVTIYVADSDEKWVRLVQEQLAKIDAGYTMPQRRFLPDIKKVRWVWNITFFAPREWLIGGT